MSPELEVTNMFYPEYEKAYAMCKYLTDKHIGRMNNLVLKYVVLDYIDYRTGENIEEVTPYLLIDFK